MSETFQALVVDKNDIFSVGVKQLTLEELPAGEVLIKVAYSSVNYKDGLASIPNGNIVRNYPFIPGIDLSGTVVSSEDSRFQPGQPVIATSYGIGVSHYGGFSEYARIPAEWVIPLPEGLSLREAMIYGTAGFTAAMSIQALEDHGAAPDKGKVLVTGATGGVGGTAVAMLAKLGYEVTASTGRTDEAGYLQQLGAAEVISREEVGGAAVKPLDKQLWQAAVDSVGGSPLAAVLSKIAYGGAVAASGLTAGTAVPTTVMPFILRGVSLLGIDSVSCPAGKRQLIWARMANDLKPDNLDVLVDREITLTELPAALEDILKSNTRGRVLVRLS
ncbi:MULTISPECIES: acryloyl-CoA reductase [unclassified Paenibacillus]|uniref:acrylyl-CoA reductase family protein n=1 Tax=unclassified Paenibacillus TaxID=185978 RepID=UPI0024050032|nr:MULTISPECIES: acryloyl-CoA reductase [unclassified Paenibacillus]MDF9845102.1 acrylyl-CoA reductase (NADPH) [Paenibacillus sp. PastF-2]MDF9851667.1 acrylyl-CoA reductase (NADPH) [Paenibacillus sp. PastM-2]MDF9858251.1 acrylyl-CoA reductase (NADPH) [Paenibacillus sp. PastF-1]MDH6483515.1 acrylyl-CoA reductase (NADPH) [Paenibacillus sp. PastH-2]MDH6510961.1 acrylyl-CoA reductase (NADPH) [Paenibacillus sp. PastM-3]